MTITKQRIIDQKAQKIFERNIPDSWLIRDQHPDIFVDYFIEIAEESQIPSGLLWGVQLKGTEHPKYSKNKVKLQFETKSLIYYFDKLRSPLFIVLVDINSEECYYIFIQQILYEIPPEIEWRKQKSMLLAFDLSDNLKDHSKLLSSILKADSYLRELWPSSIPAATKHEKKKLEELDPRFEVYISQSNEKINYQLKPRENVPLRLSLTETEENRNAIQEFFDYGKSCTIKGKDVSLIGSQLFDEIIRKSIDGKFTIASHKKDVKIELRILDKNSKIKALLYGIEAKFSSGRKGLLVEGNYCETPFNISISFSGKKIHTGVEFDVLLNFQEPVWLNQPVRSLPYFEDLNMFFKEFNKDDKIHVRCTLKGNQLFKGIAEENLDSNYMKSISDYLSIIQKLRVISKHFNYDINLQSMESISNDDLRNINIVYCLISNKQYETHILSLAIEMDLKPKSAFFDRMDEFKKNISEVKYETESSFYILGNKFHFPKLEYLLEKVKIEILEELSIKQDKIPIKIIAVPHSLFKISLLTK